MSEPKGVAVSPVEGAQEGSGGVAATRSGSSNGSAVGDGSRALNGLAFPLGTFREAAMELRRPFAAAAIKFKVQSQFGTDGALIVPYIDARLVIERLNLIVPHLWSDRYVALDGKTLQCDLTVDGITRSDVGQSNQAKGLRSDAFKRAAVKFGVGVSLYAVPRTVLKISEHGRSIQLRGAGEKKSIVITSHGDAALRSSYAKWLEEHGVRNFGRLLDHGDIDVSTGDPEAEEELPELDEPALQLVEGEEADGLRERARELYGQVAGLVGRSAYPPGEFQAGLESHGTSVDGLRTFVLALEVRLGEAAAAKALA